MPRIIFFVTQQLSATAFTGVEAKVPMKEPTMHRESTQQKVSAVPSLGNPQISKSKLTWKANYSISPS